MSDTTFWFATFDVEGVAGDVTDFDPSQGSEDLVRENIREYVRTNEVVTESATGRWYFGAIDDRGDTIYGKFGKEFTEESSAYDESVGDFVDDVDANVDAQYSMFVLNFPNRLLIYNTRNRVGQNQFRQNFARGYNESFSGSMGVDPLKNRADVNQVVADFNVHNAEFELEPSNPGADEEWEALDDHIQDMLADKLGIEVEALEGSGLNFDDELLAEMFEMAKSEYGEFRIHYDEDGFIKKITSGGGEQIAKRRPEPEGLGGLREMSQELISFASTFLD
jgi:hypothetical protein